MDGPRTLPLQTSSKRAYFPLRFPNHCICQVPCHMPRQGGASVLQLEAMPHLQVCTGQLQTHTPPLGTVCTCRVMPNSFRMMQYKFDLPSQRVTEKHFFIKKKMYCFLHESAFVEHEGGKCESLIVRWNPRRWAYLRFLSRMPVLELALDHVHLVWRAKCTHFQNISYHLGLV